jgi:hypothetical protein
VRTCGHAHSAQSNSGVPLWQPGEKSTASEKLATHTVEPLGIKSRVPAAQPTVLSTTIHIHADRTGVVNPSTACVQRTASSAPPLTDARV